MFQGPLLSRYSCGDRSMLIELGGCDSKAANLTGLTFCQSTEPISRPRACTLLVRAPPFGFRMLRGESADCYDAHCLLESVMHQLKGIDDFRRSRGITRWRGHCCWCSRRRGVSADSGCPCST